MKVVKEHYKKIPDRLGYVLKTTTYESEETLSIELIDNAIINAEKFKAGSDKTLDKLKLTKAQITDTLTAEE